MYYINDNILWFIDEMRRTNETTILFSIVYEYHPNEYYSNKLIYIVPVIQIKSQYNIILQYNRIVERSTHRFVFVTRIKLIFKP